MVPARLPGQAARAGRVGANLASDRAVVRRIWEEFLGGQVSPPAGRAGISPDGLACWPHPGIDRAAAPASC